LTQPSHRIAYRGGFLAVELMGPEDGWPLFFFHGWPGSRMQRPPDDRELRRAGARLVTMDRPGLGHSTPVRHRRVADWGAAVEAVADHLGIARFAVLGVSGGGPYALAVAAGLAHRVRRVLVCGGVPPQSGPDAYRTLHMASRMPRARVRWLRGEGHYSPLFLRMGELLEALAPDA
jgi:pimeloyl-ACP methyl ester carboxylesterase